jgi:hypothetical protein
MKGCLERGSSKKVSATDTEKAKKIIRGKFKYPRKNTTKGWFPKEAP